MIWFMLPLAFSLSIAFSILPNARAIADTPVRRMKDAVCRLLMRTAGKDASALAPLLFLLLFAALLCIPCAILDMLHPFFTALLIAPTIVFFAPLRDALAVREALEDGECATDEARAAYEQRVMTAIGDLGETLARRTLPLVLLCTILAPFRLAAVGAWTLYALHLCAQDGCVPARRADDFLARAGEVLMILCIIPTAALCGTEMGMAYRARNQGVRHVLLSAVGVDPQLRHGHRPVTGDISQSCLCVCVALVVMYLPVMFLMALWGV